MVSDKTATPMACGILRPQIILPKSMDLTDTLRVRHILAHELVHIRRFDAVWKGLLIAALCIHWFNPVVWVMYVLANKDLELACDESVVRRLGESGRTAYAMTLIGMAERRVKYISVNGFNFSKERIKSIMKYRKYSFFAIAISVLLVAGVMAACTATAGQRLAPMEEEVPNAAIPDDDISPKPITEEALPQYWEMGALDVDGVPYLPLVETAEDLGYMVDERTESNGDTNEYQYEVKKDGQSLFITNIKIRDNAVDEWDIGGKIRVSDRALINFTFQDNILYMPAQFYKEVLDTDNTLP